MHYIKFPVVIKKNETFCTSCLVLRHAVRWLLELFMQNISCLSCLCLYTANQINKKYYLQKNWWFLQQAYAKFHKTTGYKKK